MQANGRMAVQQYSQVNLYGGIADASPHRLVQMLFEGALQRIASAKAFMERGKIAEKCLQIGRVIDIVGTLRSALDMGAGGEIARNLDALYSHMEYRLAQANAGNDPAALDEVSALLQELKSGWDAIADEASRAPAAAR